MNNNKRKHKINKPLMKVIDLPDYVLLQIFQYLPQSYVIKMMKLHRAFRQLARIRLCERIFITEKKFNHISRNVNSLNDYTLINRFKLNKTIIDEYHLRIFLSRRKCVPLTKTITLDEMTNIDRVFEKVKKLTHAEIKFSYRLGYLDSISRNLFPDAKLSLGMVLLNVKNNINIKNFQFNECLTNEIIKQCESLSICVENLEIYTDINVDSSVWIKQWKSTIYHLKSLKIIGIVTKVLNVMSSCSISMPLKNLSLDFMSNESNSNLLELYGESTFQCIDFSKLNSLYISINGSGDFDHLSTKLPLYLGRLKQLSIFNYSDPSFELQIKIFLINLKPNTVQRLLIKSGGKFSNCIEEIERQLESLEKLVWKGYWGFMLDDFESSHNVIEHNKRNEPRTVISDVGRFSCSCREDRCMFWINRWHQNLITKYLNDGGLNNIKLISLSSLHFSITKNRNSEETKVIPIYHQFKR